MKIPPVVTNPLRRSASILASDREPFIFIEYAQVLVQSGAVVACTSHSTMNLPVASIMCLLLGRGVSITSDAAALCAKYNCYIVYVTGGINVQSIWHCGKYANPQRLAQQLRAFTDPQRRLAIGKHLIQERLRLIPEFTPSTAILDGINGANSIPSLTGQEGALTRSLYAFMAQKYQIPFRRETECVTDRINSSLSLLNHCLYGVVTTLILCLGYSPSLGFIHGQTRRGGLTFDIADVVKPILSLEPAFQQRDTHIIRGLADRLNHRRKYWIKYLINLIEACYVNPD